MFSTMGWNSALAADTDIAACDEERLALDFEAENRRREGRYFTPAALVDLTFDLASPLVPARGPVAIIDPACGAGAFLAAGRRFLPSAALFGLELSGEIARRCQKRVSSAIVLQGDALRGGLHPLLTRIPRGAFEVWVGNPPYNGTSSLLKDASAYEAIRKLLPRKFSLPRGTSLRDDFAFFLLIAASRLRTRAGALAFVTSSTLLDSYLYSELRRSLLESLSLREVVDLGPGMFFGTRVRTCLTVWSSAPANDAARFLRRSPGHGQPFRASQLGPPILIRPRAPEWLLRSTTPEADSLDLGWRTGGETVSTLVPISFPGLKTRFDELLVDEEPRRLLDRLSDLLACPAGSLSGFADRHAIPGHCLPKLRMLKLEMEREPFSIDATKVRPFFRYAGSKHRGTIPSTARAYCYLDRRLIPRGDHRLRGEYDPHACLVKLVFNARELPLSASLLEESGCVHDHRHSRFAPLLVPSRLSKGSLALTRSGGALGSDVPNLSAKGLALASKWGSPLKVFRAVVGFINSQPVQEVWAPVYGTTRELPVPVGDWLKARNF